MPNLHFIAVGGTGHKVSESLIHLAACGAFKDSGIDGLRIITIDGDDGNGNLNAAKETQQSYNAFYRCLGEAAAKLGLVNVVEARHLSISPASDGVNGVENSIEGIFNVNALYNGMPQDRLIRFLYTDEEIGENLRHGFCGHTTVGTLIVKDILTQHDAWKKFLAEINDGDFVMVAGSVFGGTGASCIPVILNELKQYRENGGPKNFKFASLMLMPYFEAVGEIKEAGDLQPDARKFQMKAKAALHYYREQAQYNIPDAMYVIGEPEENYSKEIASRGGGLQHNKPHPVELFAASSVFDFVGTTSGASNERVRTAWRDAIHDNAGKKHFYTWDMVNTVRSFLSGNMQRFAKIAVFYNKVICGSFVNGQDPGIWRDMYKELDVNDSDSKPAYEKIASYCKRFVDWLYDLHMKNKEEAYENTVRLNSVRNEQVKLFELLTSGNKKIFDDIPVTTDCGLKGFSEMVFDQSKGITSEQIYNELCSIKPKGKDKGFAALFSILYDVVSESSNEKAESVLVTRSKEPPVPFYTTADAAGDGAKPVPGRLWSAVGADNDRLEYIAKGLSSRETISRNDLSIPSPWSIFIMNEIVLTGDIAVSDADDKSYYHQWCALITLIALREFNRYAKNEYNPDGLEIVPIQNDGNSFFKAVSGTLEPKNKIFQEHSWVQSSCVTLGGETIAFLANNTLVCPAFSFEKTKDLLHKIAPSIVRIEADDKDKRVVFMPPETYFNDAQDKNSKDALLKFLNAAKTVIAEVAKQGTGNSFAGRIRDKLDSFIGDLRKGGNVPENTNIVIPPFDAADVVSPDNIFCKLIPSPLKMTSTLPFELLGINGERTVIVGPEIAGIKQTDPKAAHICITEDLRYNRMDSAQLAKLTGELVKEIRLIDPDTLLLDKMVLVEKTSHGSQNGFHSLDIKYACDAEKFKNKYVVIWPVSNKLLELYPAGEEINSMLTIESANEDSVTVSLCLAIGDAMKHVVRKTYHKNQPKKGVCTLTVLSENKVPVWAVWPYARYIKDGQNAWKMYAYMCLKPAAEVKDWLEIIPLGAQLHKPMELKENNLHLGEPEVRRQAFYARSSELPVALKIMHKEPVEGKNEYCGTVFLKEPKAYYGSKKDDKDWKVGLDFGTTSTTAFFKPKGGDVQFVNVLSEYKMMDGKNPMMLEEKPVIKDHEVIVNFDGWENVERYFVDKWTLDQQSYITVYEDFGGSSDDSDGNIFNQGRIFWHNCDAIVSPFEHEHDLSMQRKIRERWKDGIKWEGNKAYTRKYLTQLMTQIVFKAVKEEGVGSIKWHFSYPTAFSQDDFGNFKDALLDILVGSDRANNGGLQAVSGIDVVGSVDANFRQNFSNNFFTESFAAARHFKKTNDKATTFLCIDIGGGTSDISICVDGLFVFQTSIPLASRDMFVSPLNKFLNAGILQKLQKKIGYKSYFCRYLEPKMDVEGNHKRHALFMELALAEFRTDVQRHLDELYDGDDDEKAEKEFQKFRQKVFRFYAGLVYYIACVIIKLRKDKKIPSEAYSIVFGHSGKGSLLQTWIEENCKWLRSGAEDFINKNVQGGKITFQLPNNSGLEEAKTGTAKGLICDVDMDFTPAEPSIFLGCKITATKAGGKTKPFNEDSFAKIGETSGDEFFAKPRDLSVSISREAIKETLDNFVKFHNGLKLGKMDVIKSDGIDWDLIREKVNSASRYNLNNGRFEPPFITILKEFFDSLNELEK